MHEFIEAHQTKFIFNNEFLHHSFFSFLNFIAFVVLAWLGLKLIDKLVNKLTHSLQIHEKDSILLRFMPLLRKSSKILFILVFLVFVLKIYGFSASTLVTGIGLGGVVFGLAAQKTIVNIFGSVSLIVDKAYKVGDYICVNISLKGKDVEGYVEDITLRSTKIRSLDGTLFNIPNGSLSDNVVQNLTYIQKRLFKETINLTYSVSTEDIEKAKEICINILKNNENVMDNYLAEVSSLNSYSVDILLMANVKPIPIKEFLTFKNNILTEIYSKFNENNIEFAFPTQTIELKQ